MDCSQFTQLVGFNFANHRTNFTAAAYSRVYSESLARTLHHFDTKGSIFKASESYEITQIITPDGFRKCENQEKMLQIINTRASNETKLPNIYELLLSILLSRMDPHSHLFTKSQWANLDIGHANKKSGIGITFSISNDIPVVLQVLKGGPSEGILLPGDRIVEIDGIESDSLENNMFSDLLNCDSDSKILLVVERGSQKLTFELHQTEFIKRTVDWGYLDNKQNFIYLKISDFETSTAEEIATALLEAKTFSTYRGLIVDLRFNSGGILQSAINALNIFIDSQILGITKSKVSQRSLKPTETPEFVDRETPLILLINTLSASSAELFAQSIKDFNRGVIVGETSFGKMTAQSVLSPEFLSKHLNDEFEVGETLTVEDIFSAFGKTSQHFGLAPHIKIKDLKLSKLLRAKKAESRKKGSTIYLSEREYDNPIIPYSVQSSLAENNKVTNRISEIVKAIKLEDFPDEAPDGRNDEANFAASDIQLETALKHISFYANFCTSFHIDTCDFPGDIYAVK